MHHWSHRHRPAAQDSTRQTPGRQCAHTRIRLTCARTRVLRPRSALRAVLAPPVPLLAASPAASRLRPSARRQQPQRRSTPRAAPRRKPGSAARIPATQVPAKARPSGRRPASQTCPHPSRGASPEAQQLAGPARPAAPASLPRDLSGPSSRVSLAPPAPGACPSRPGPMVRHLRPWAAPTRHAPPRPHRHRHPRARHEHRLQQRPDRLPHRTLGFPQRVQSHRHAATLAALQAPPRPPSCPPPPPRAASTSAAPPPQLAVLAPLPLPPTSPARLSPTPPRQDPHPRHPRRPPPPPHAHSVPALGQTRPHPPHPPRRSRALPAESMRPSPLSQPRCPPKTSRACWTTAAGPRQTPERPWGGIVRAPAQWRAPRWPGEAHVQVRGWCAWRVPAWAGACRAPRRTPWRRARRPSRCRGPAGACRAAAGAGRCRVRGPRPSVRGSPEGDPPPQPGPGTLRGGGRGEGRDKTR